MSGSRPTPRLRQQYLNASTVPPGVLTFEMPDGSFAHAADTRIPFEIRRQAGLEASRAARREATKLHAELAGMLLDHNAIGIYSVIVIQERLSRRLAPQDMFGYDAAVDYLGGLILSLPRERVEATIGLSVTRAEVLRADDVLRQIASAEAESSAADILDHPDQRNASARYQLLQERQLDRMAGYYPHLRTIVGRAFTLIDSAARARLGFGPSDALALADVHVGWHEGELFDLLHASVGDGLEPTIERLTQMMARRRESTLGERALGAVPVDLVLAALTTELGSLNVENMSSANRLRTFPVVPLPGGRYLWARPYDFLHEALDWFDQLLVEREEEKLRQRLSDIRRDVSEQLTAERLADVFGTERTHPNAEYQISATEWAEADTVVELPRVSVAVEAKGHRMTDAGRAAHPARVRKKFEELITDPLRQSDRTRNALLSAAAVRNQRTKTAIDLGPAEQVLRVVVLLDRVDPFAGAAAAAAGKDLADGDDGYAWIVSLADLLMVTDLLRRPAELYAYIKTRCEQTATGSPRIISESDALGAWLRSREGVWDAPEDVVFMLEDSSEAINEYFTRLEMHNRHPEHIDAPLAPSTFIPPVVIAALDRLLTSNDDNWAAAAEAVGAVKPRIWAVVERDVVRLRLAPQTRNQRKASAAAMRGRRLGDGLILKLGKGDAISVADGAVALTVATDAPASAAPPSAFANRSPDALSLSSGD